MLKNLSVSKRGRNTNALRSIVSFYSSDKQTQQIIQHDLIVFTTIGEIMKKLMMIAMFALVSVNANAKFSLDRDYLKLVKCLVKNRGDVTQCLKYLNEDTARSAGIVQMTQRGNGNNEAECKEDAVSKVESSILYECERQNDAACSLSGEVRYNNDLADNPAVTIGGLSGKKKTCSATGYAKPN